MRGSPLVQAVILVVALALAGIPVWSLTRPHEEPRAAKPIEAQRGSRKVDLTVDSTAPAEASLTYEGKTVWQGSTADGISLELPVSAVELVASARWTSQTGKHAVRFQVSQDGDEIASVSLWGETDASEVISLPATKGAAP